jgi:hypothetical protein
VIRTPEYGAVDVVKGVSEWTVGGKTDNFSLSISFLMNKLMKKEIEKKVLAVYYNG